MEDVKKYIDVNELLTKLNGVFSVRQIDLIKAIIYSCNLKEIENDKKSAGIDIISCYAYQYDSSFVYVG